MTLEHEPRAGHTGIPRRSPEEEGMRRAAMIFLATGRTAGALRAGAADPVFPGHVSALCGKDEAAITELMLSLAGAMDELDAEGFDAAAFAATLPLPGGAR